MNPQRSTIGIGVFMASILRENDSEWITVQMEMSTVHGVSGDIHSHRPHNTII